MFNFKSIKKLVFCQNRDIDPVLERKKQVNKEIQKGKFYVFIVLGGVFMILAL